MLYQFEAAFLYWVAFGRTSAIDCDSKFAILTLVCLSGGQVWCENRFFDITLTRRIDLQYNNMNVGVCVC